MKEVVLGFHFYSFSSETNSFAPSFISSSIGDAKTVLVNYLTKQIYI
jgi:hypothetical protein